MLRRDFLRRLTTTAAGLLVADDALELLSHRKVWAGHDLAAPIGNWPVNVQWGISENHSLLRASYREMMERAYAAPRFYRVGHHA